MAFDEVLFPVAISKGSTTGPTLRYDVIEYDSGDDMRVSRWPTERRSWNAGVGIQSERRYEQLEAVYKFYLAREGIMRGFRYRDPIDYSSAANLRGAHAMTDQNIGQGDGTKTLFQLKRTLDDGINSVSRTIQKPRSGTVLLAIDGIAKTTGFSVDYSNGEILFDTAPLGGGSPEVITAGFLFDCPVQFSSELQSLEVLLGEFELGQIPEIPIQEMVGDVITPAQWPRGGQSAISISANTLYDFSMGETVHITPTAAGLSVAMPDNSELELGAPVFTFINGSATDSMTFTDRSDGTVLWTLPADTSCIVALGEILGVRSWIAMKGVA